jgi:hypothetical protein
MLPERNARKNGAEGKKWNEVPISSVKDNGCERRTKKDS